MKNFIIILSVIAFFSCNGEEEFKPKKSKNIPGALQERSVDVSSRMKRSDTDLVETLYKEVLNKDPSLMQLENEINALKENKTDSLKTFSLYEKNNSDYYAIYQKHLAEIKDTVLRARMKKMLDSSTVNYKNKIKAQQKIYDSTNNMYNTLSDLHWLLKLSKTLAVMESYQDNNIPDTTTLLNTLDKLNNTVKLSDSVIKQTPQPKPTTE